MKKTRLFSLDFIRALACIMIVVFHFSIDGRKLYTEGSILKNFSLGCLGVSLFIILSGVALSLSDKKISYWEYLKKRIKTIYPLIYICSIFFVIIYFMFFPTIFDNIPLYRLIYSIIGIDGLLSYKISTFNIVGEWYIGCIMILYLIYPFIKKCIDKFPYITFFILLTIYLLVIHFYGLELSMDRNPLVRLFDLALGIYFVKIFIKKPISENKKKICYFISTIVMIFTLFIKNDICTMYNITLGGISTFVVLYGVSNYIRINGIKNIISIISKHSYVIFLVHHQIQLLLSARFSGYEYLPKRYYAIFIMYLILVWLAVVFINKVYNYIKEFISKVHTKYDDQSAI